MVNVKVSGFCCRLWISTQNNTTLVQGLETLITIVLNLYIFSLHTLLRHEIRYLWIRARYEQNVTGALGDVPRGSHDTRVYSSDPWCGHWWAQHLRSGAPVVTSCDPWWWMAGVALAHDKEFKGTLFQVDHVEIRENRRAWSIKWPIETFNTVMANVPRCNLLLVLAPSGCFSLQRRGQSGSAVSWAGPRAGYLMTSPAQPARPDTIFKGCSMLIVPGTQQPTQCGETACKNAGSQIIPLFKS